MWRVLVCCAAAASAAPALWPLPKEAHSGKTTVAVDPTQFQFRAAGGGAPSADLAAAFERCRTQCFPHRAGAAAGAAAVEAVVEVADDAAELQLGVDESYRLTVEAAPAAVRIEAATQFGAYHALETLSQLLFFNATDGRGAYVIRNAPWDIRDAPRFPHREVLLDTSRHFQPVASLKAAIQSFTYAKINTLHWHLLDNQSFPWVPPSMPVMARGAFSPYEMYTQQDVEDVVQYAKARGVRVVMEMDTPGHAASWCVGRPDVCPAPNCTSPLRPDTEATFELYETLADDLFKVVPDAYFHIGGDEVNTGCWEKNPEIVQWMRSKNLTAHGAYLYFVQRVAAIVRAKGKHAVGWDELWANFNTSLDKNTVIHQWRNWLPVAKAATGAGYRVIMSNLTPWYLNGATFTWQQVYEEEPCAGLTDEECQRVIGGGGELWGEGVDPSDLQTTLWPRLAAVGERLWSDKAQTANASAAESRYASFRCYLTRQGVAAPPHSNPEARQPPAGPGSCLAQ